MKRSRTPDYSDRVVFGVPLVVTQQRHGQPLPQCVLYAMRRLRRAAADAVGVFRKSGVQSRIAALREQLEADPGQFCRCRDRQPATHSDPLNVLSLAVRRGRSPPRTLLAVPNVTAHPSTASIPTSYY